MSGSSGSDARPLSPHLQVWRPHVTMAASITHRITGVALYFGTFLIAGWIIALATGAECYDAIEGILAQLCSAKTSAGSLFPDADLLFGEVSLR